MSLRVSITKRLKGFTLQVDFESTSEPLGILGASGSGKSMTLKCIAGIETPDEGIIEVNGRVLFDSKEKINVKPQKRRVGYLFQNYALFPHMTVEKNIACALAGDKTEQQEKITELLARYELTGYEKRYPGQLSGGQQQRVALARIMAYQPEVLLLDEPFSALDAYLKEALQVEMLELLKNWEGEALMVSHSRDEVYRICQKLLVLEDGRTLGFGDAKAMFQKPENLTVAKLTGCKNFSRAKQTGENIVEALDWGCALRVEGPVPEDLSHIGIRAHYFKPCAAEAQNAIPVRVLQRIESPFEWDILFENARIDTPRAKESTIWWKYAKEDNITAMPQYLCISPSDVLLLR